MLILDKVGRPIAKHDKGKYNGMAVSVTEQFQNNDEKEENDGNIREIRRLRTSNDSKFQQVANTSKERDILYITGCSGSGKSTHTRKFIEELRKGKKDIPIYLFSSLPDDESLDSVKPKKDDFG